MSSEPKGTKSECVRVYKRQQQGSLNEDAQRVPALVESLRTILPQRALANKSVVHEARQIP
jgi:hypothetical protein